MRTIKLIVEYDGTELSGWQRQKNGPSVQQHLEEAVASMVRHPVTVLGASRTDARVHARGQVAHFQTERTISAYGFRRGLNGLLPPCIAVREASEAPADFHARFSARGKHYRYTLLVRRERAPLWHNRAWHRPRPAHTLDLGAMRTGAAHLLGEHDFAAFRATGCSARTTTREITGIEISHAEADIVYIDVRGNAFLRNMVRIMAGTLVELGEGRLDPQTIPAILSSRDRARAGETAPAHGLTLVEVLYPAISTE